MEKIIKGKLMYNVASKSDTEEFENWCDSCVCSALLITNDTQYKYPIKLWLTITYDNTFTKKK